MTPAERKLLDKLDKLVLSSSGEEFKKIQEIDLLTQMDGKSLYDSYNNSFTLENQNIEHKSTESRK